MRTQKISECILRASALIMATLVCNGLDAQLKGSGSLPATPSAHLVSSERHEHAGFADELRRR